MQLLVVRKCLLDKTQTQISHLAIVVELLYRMLLRPKGICKWGGIGLLFPSLTLIKRNIRYCSLVMRTLIWHI
jgi:hypothetical protein